LKYYQQFKAEIVNKIGIKTTIFIEENNPIKTMAPTTLRKVMQIKIIKSLETKLP
jgi:hypothetical protein